jgi:hypothetical protein
VTDTIQTAHEQIKVICQSARDSSKKPSLETRLSILEDCLTRHFDDSHRIAESIRRIELGIPASRSERTELMHQSQPLHTRTREDQQWDRIGRQSMSAPHKPPFSIAPDGYPTYNNTTRIGLTAAKSEVQHDLHTHPPHGTTLTVKHEPNTINMIDRSTSRTCTIQTGYPPRHFMPPNVQYSFRIRICVQSEHPYPSSPERRRRTPYGFWRILNRF